MKFTKTILLTIAVLTAILFACTKQTEEIQQVNRPVLEICDVPISTDSTYGRGILTTAIPDDAELYPLVDLNSQYWTGLVWIKITPTTINTPYWNQGRTFTTKQVIYDTNLIRKFIYHCDRAYFYWRIKFTADSTEYTNYTGNKVIVHTVSSIVSTAGTGDNSLYPGVGGVAYVGSLFWSDPLLDDAFVFADLYFYNIDKISTIIHETGHTIGLRHQKVYDTLCSRINEYRPNCYMGNSLFPNRGGWIIGPSQTCTTIQNDTLILNNALQKRYR